MPELIITRPAPATTGSLSTDDPCLRNSAEPADSERHDCEQHLQLPGGLRLDESGSPAGAIRNAPEDKAEADRIAERLDLDLKTRFGGPEGQENPVDRERLPEIPVETWQKVEIRNRDNQR